MRWRNWVVRILVGFLALHLTILGLMFAFQEKLIFHENPLSQDHQFDFAGNFEELKLPAKDGTPLSALLFHAEKPKGLVYFLHGNSGNLQGWGYIAESYTRRGYDLLIPDYRGFGKSGGHIISEKQVFDDTETTFAEALKRYPKDKIIIAGYSIGTGPAARLAAVHQPRELILLSPYYNLLEMTHYRYPFVPDFLLQYDFNTAAFLNKVNVPVHIFHGRQDRVIPYQQSQKLAKENPGKITYRLLENQDHFHMNDNPEYQTWLDAEL